MVGGIYEKGTLQGSFRPLGLTRLFAGCSVLEIKSCVTNLRISHRQTLDLGKGGGSFRHAIFRFLGQTSDKKKLKRIGVGLGGLC